MMANLIICCSFLQKEFHHCTCRPKLSLTYPVFDLEWDVSKLAFDIQKSHNFAPTLISFSPALKESQLYLKGMILQGQIFLHKTVLILVGRCWYSFMALLQCFKIRLLHTKWPQSCQTQCTISTITIDSIFQVALVQINHKIKRSTEF